jgi:putative oxidoreductase
VSRLVALVRLALGAVFLYAAATKLPDMGAFAESIANYRLVPAALVAAAAAAVVGVELAVGVLLVTGVRARAASLAAAALLAVFTVGLSQALLRGIDLRCGCFGGSEKATWITVVRDVALLAAAALVVARGPGRLEKKATGYGLQASGKAPVQPGAKPLP